MYKDEEREERWRRIQMIQLEMTRLKVETDSLVTEASRCRDQVRMSEISERMHLVRQEMEILFASLTEIRREQIMESDPPKAEHWWHRLFGRRVDA